MFFTRVLTQDIVISNELKYYITSENLKEGDRLPSERDLCERLGVQRLTMRSALKVLLQEGWIVSKERSGYYVAKQRIQKDVSKIESTSYTISSQGFDMEIKLLEFKVLEVNKAMVEAMQIPLGTRVYYIKRLRLIDREPVSIEKSYIPVSAAPNLEQYDLEKYSLYQILEEQYHIVLHHSQQDIIVKHADEEACRLLELPDGSDVVEQRGNVFGDTCMEYSESVMDIRRFQYQY